MATQEAGDRAAINKAAWLNTQIRHWRERERASVVSCVYHLGASVGTRGQQEMQSLGDGAGTVRSQNLDTISGFLHPPPDTKGM